MFIKVHVNRIEFAGFCSAITKRKKEKSGNMLRINQRSSEGSCYLGQKWENTTYNSLATNKIADYKAQVDCCLYDNV